MTVLKDITIVNPTSAFNEIRIAEAAAKAGWTFAYNVNTEIVNVDVTGGTVTQADGQAVLSTGASASQSARIETILPLRYIPGIGGFALFTAVFDTPVVNNTQHIGLGTDQNALYLGFTDLDFVIGRTSDSTPDEEIIDNFNGRIPTDDLTLIDKGNVFFIQFQWLGYGPIRFGYETPDRRLIVMHEIQYPSTSNTPSLVNPTMPMFAEVVNTTNTSDIVMKTPSAMAFREGKVGIYDVDPLILVRPFENTATITGSTETPILSIRATSTYQSVTNLIQPIISSMSLASDGNKSVIFRAYRNVSESDLTGESFVDYDTNVSSLQSDTSASALSGGDLYKSFPLAKVSQSDSNIPFQLALAPGEILTITAESSNASDIFIGLQVGEPF